MQQPTAVRSQESLLSLDVAMAKALVPGWRQQRLGVCSGPSTISTTRHLAAEMGWKNATENRWMDFQEMQTSRAVIESSRLFRGLLNPYTFYPLCTESGQGAPGSSWDGQRPLQCVESSSPVQAVCMLTAAGRVIQRGEDHSLRSRAFYHCSSELEAASARGRENGSPGLLVLSGSLVGSQTSSEQSSGNESRAYLFITKFKKLGLQTCHVVSSPLHLCTLIPE